MLQIFGWILVCIVLGLAIFVQRKSAKTKSQVERIKSYPEPKDRNFLGHLAPLLKLSGAQRLEIIRSWFDELGSTIRMQRTPFRWIVSTRDLNVLRTVFINEDVKSFTKGKDYELLQSWLGNGILLSEGESWHHKRKMMSHAFSPKAIHNMIPIFTKCTNVLVDYLNKHVDQEVDMSVLFTRLTLDIIGETSFSFSFNSLKDEGGLNEEFMNILNMIQQKFVKHMLMPIPIWLQFTQSGKSFLRSVKALHGITDDIIKKRIADKEREKSADTTPHDLLDYLIEAVGDNEKKFSPNELRDEIMTFLFAGHDTTSSALTFALAQIATYPQVQQEISTELSKAWSTVDPAFSPPTIQDINNLTYTTMTLKESMRLYPPVGFVSRQSTREVNLPGGVTLPENMTVSCSINSLHIDPQYFPDPRKFNPENFSNENSNKRDPNAFCPFALGPRNCIGQYFAMVEARLVLGILFKNFTFELAPGHTVEPDPKVVLKAKNGARFIVRKKQEK